MAGENFLKVERERNMLREFLRLFLEWEKAMQFAQTTGRKHDAYKAADQVRSKLDAQLATVKPYIGG